MSRRPQKTDLNRYRNLPTAVSRQRSSSSRSPSSDIDDDLALIRPRPPHEAKGYPKPRTFFGEEDAVLSLSPLEHPRAGTTAPLVFKRFQNNFMTPCVSVPKDPSLNFSETDDLSPVPASRRILSRVGSRNLKENVSHQLDSGLASPFHSRPGSRTASPGLSTQGPAKRPRLHTKSRTLSSDMNRHFSHMATSPPAVDDASATVLRIGSQPVYHNRTASIPTLPTFCLDQLAPHGWLVPPKSLSRSPGGGDDTLAQSGHASFYFDVPVAASTPAKRLYTETSIYTGDSLDMDTTAQETALLDLVPSVEPKQPSRRRRTILRAPHDSLFSSVLDFSAYVTDEDSPDHIKRLNKSATQSQDAIQKAVYEPEHRYSRNPLSSTHTPSPPRTPGTDMIAESPPPFNPAVSRAQSMSPTQGNELSALFKSMDLTGISTEGDSEGSLRSLITNPSPFHNPGHRRKRGDTIRASDFIQPPTISTGALLPSVSSDNINVAERTRPGSLRNTQRLRSGTITLANARDSVAPAHVGIIEKIIHPPKPDGPKRKRRQDRKPQFKRTVHDKPLSPQGSDEPDDELLLTGEEWKDPQTELTS